MYVPFGYPVNAIQYGPWRKWFAWKRVTTISDNTVFLKTVYRRNVWNLVHWSEPGATLPPGWTPYKNGKPQVVSLRNVEYGTLFDTLRVTE